MRCHCRTVLLLAAFVFLGLGSWIAINSVYQELPYICLVAPEGYALYSWIAILVSISNLFVFGYLALISIPCISSNKIRRMIDRLAIYIVVGFVGVIACFG